MFNMNEKTQLYVFSKKELILVFLFTLLVALTSFVFGIKIGKDFSYEVAGYTEADRIELHLQSQKEEKVNNIIEQIDDGVVEEKEVTPPANEENLNIDLEKALKEKFDKEFTDEVQKNEQAKSPEMKIKETTPTSENESLKIVENPKEIVQKESENIEEKKDALSGKYTIQLASYRAIKDAEQFANGFKIRGYNPIINEVDLKDKGIWYRVSLGIFESIADAKEYLLEEKSLFYGMDPRFVKFD